MWRSAWLARNRLAHSRGHWDEVLAEARNPVGIVTKNHLVTRDVDLLGELAAHRAAKVYLSVTTLDRELQGKVRGITTFGAFVEILPGKEGLVHISELALSKVDKVEDVLSMGDEVEVKCLGVDPQGKIKLSRKVLLATA